MENNENKKNIEIQNERETRRKEKIMLILVTFFNSFGFSIPFDFSFLAI